MSSKSISVTHSHSHPNIVVHGHSVRGYRSLRFMRDLYKNDSL